jgi:serine/threonine protein kinase
MPIAGELLGDRYRLEDRIAAGGMGEVWRATDTVLARDVAVKTLRADRAGDPGFEERFRHEARSMAALHHPGIADVYDFGQDDADAYIVMEYVNGTALNHLIAERGRLTPDETMSIVAQAGRALDAAHQAGIVHRDVKPGNLIIEPDGTVVLVDFGVARSAESAALTGAKEVVGTALSIAPEQVSKEETGPPADVYALGAVAYHCLAGHPPFEGESPIAVAIQHVQEEPPPLPPDVPQPVRALVARAMAKNPADRFPSAAAMAAAAAQLGSGDATTVLLAAVSSSDRTQPVAVPVPPDVPPTLPDPSGQRRRRTLLATAAALIGLGVLATVLVWANPGGIFPGDDPVTTPTVTTSNAPASQGSGDGGAPTSTRTPQTSSTKAPAKPIPTTTRPSASPSSSPTSEPPSEPNEDSSQPTSEQPSEPGGDNGGDNGGDGGNGGDNSGPGSGGDNGGGGGNSGPG